jgi:cell division protein ZapA
MAEVTLTIGGRRHSIACHDGEEAQVRSLGEMLDQRWPVAERAAGGMGGERAMLFVALMLADSLDEAQTRPAAKVESDLLNRLADRLESIATALEQPASAS